MQWGWYHFLGVNEHTTHIVDISQRREVGRPPSSNRIFLCGDFHGFVSFLDPSAEDPWGFNSPGLLIQSPQDDILHNSYVACYSDSGKHQWSSHIEGGVAISVAADNKGGCLLLGATLDGRVIVNGKELNGPSPNYTIENIYAFLVRFDSNGNLVWGPHQLGALSSITKVVWNETYSRFAVAFSAGSKNVVYTYDGMTPDAIINAPMFGGAFVAEFDSDGSGMNIASFPGTIVAIQYGGSALYLAGVGIDENGIGDWSLMKCNSNLTPMWSVTPPNSAGATFANSAIVAIDFDASTSTLWALGTFRGLLQPAANLDPLYGGFEPQYDVLQKTRDVFVVRVSEAGVVLWAKQSLTEAFESSHPGAISVDGEGGAVIAIHSHGAIFWPAIGVGIGPGAGSPPPAPHPNATGSYLGTGHNFQYVSGLFHLNASGYARSVTSVEGKGVAAIVGGSESFTIQGLVATGNTLVVGGDAFGNIVFAPSQAVPAQGAIGPAVHGIVTIGTWV